MLEPIHLLLLLVSLLHLELVQVPLDLRETIQLLVQFVLNFTIALLANRLGVRLLLILALLAIVLFATIREDLLRAESPRISHKV